MPQITVTINSVKSIGIIIDGEHFAVYGKKNIAELYPIRTGSAIGFDHSDIDTDNGPVVAVKTPNGLPMPHISHAWVLAHEYLKVKYGDAYVALIGDESIPKHIMRKSLNDLFVNWPFMYHETFNDDSIDEVLHDMYSAE